MKIERLKSILLIILVISSIVLTANKWFNEKLWPEGYSFLSGVTNRFSSEQNKPGAFNPNEEVLKPAKVIVNNLNNHVLFTKSSDQYDGICIEIKNILSASFESGTISETDTAEWNNHLKSKSFYFSYPVMYDASYFSSQLSKEYTGTLKYFKEFLVANDPRLPSVVYVLAKDAVTDKIEKVKINYENKDMAFLVDNASNNNGEINYYSFELNFDTTESSNVEDHVIIDHDVLINISEKKTSKISERNLFGDIASNEDLYSSILTQFNYNTSNIRKYVESDDSMVFVENYGTLKLRSNGCLSFVSVDESKGIELNTTSANTALNSCITFVNSVTDLMGQNKAMYYEITSDIHDITGQNFTLTFDYYIDDNMIIIPEDKYSVKNAITVKVAEGKIVSYDQIFVSYTPTDEEISCGSAIDAIDRLSLQGDVLPETVSDIFIAYKYEPTDSSWLPLWYIEDSKGNISMISPKAEE